MDIENSKLPNRRRINYSAYLNTNLIRNVVFFGGGIFLFIVGCIVYGLILNLREIPLNEAITGRGYSKLDDANILIDRSSYSLLLYNGTALIKTYRANFGKNINSPKCKAGDLATPVGDYKICEIDTASKYYKFFKLNYPNLNDAKDALRKGVINPLEYQRIKYSLDSNICAYPGTSLGGDVGIQGIGKLNYIFKYLPFNYNWTDGSIAISNEDIDELYSVVKKGTKVAIK
jgi:hypothetical protein